MKTAHEEAREKAERQVRLREADTWTWEEIQALTGQESGAPVSYRLAKPLARH